MVRGHTLEAWLLGLLFKASHQAPNFLHRAIQQMSLSAGSRTLPPFFLKDTATSKLS